MLNGGSGSTFRIKPNSNSSPVLTFLAQTQEKRVVLGERERVKERDFEVTVSLVFSRESVRELSDLIIG